MKRAILLMFLLFGITIPMVAQIDFEPNQKFGKPKKEEFEMSVYSRDTTASAVYLCKKAYARYRYSDDGFRIDYEHENRIKILKQDGVKYADIQISYQNNGDPRYAKENVIDISATAYNMVNGKVEKTKMKGNLVFKERVNNNTMLVKFSIPAVKEGTIIEYKYTISSDRLFEIRTWYPQASIPVIYSEYDILVPDYFSFNLESRGYDNIERVQTRETDRFTISRPGSPLQTQDCGATRLLFYGHYTPAMKVDKFMWCEDDYITCVIFELSGLSFPGQLYKSFSQKWEDIDKSLLEDEDFGYRLKMKNPYSDQMASLQLDSIKTVEGKAERIFTFLKSQIKWDEYYGLWGIDLKDVVSKKTGNNAQINFILMSMLRDAGIYCVPVVMSRRSMGILPLTHPSRTSLNTMIVGFKGNDGKLKYIDGSVENGYINVIPPVLMTNRARIVSKDFVGDKWVNLSGLGTNNKRLSILAQIDSTGIINAKAQVGYKGQHARDYKKDYKKAKDSVEFISKLERSKEIKIKSISIEGVTQFSPEVSANIEFTKQAEVNDSLIYLNPLLIVDKDSNPFLSETRIYPVELAHNENIIISVSIKIPEGYKVEEMPKPLILKLEDNGGACSYMCTNNGTDIQLQYKYNINKLTFPGHNYPQLRNFMNMVVDKNNEMIVLKKKG